MKNKRSRILKILTLAGIFGLPAFFIIVLKQGNPVFASLPYFGEHKIIQKIIDGKEVNDTIHYKVNSFTFTDIDGNLVTEKDYEDKILLVNFITGDCPNDSLNVCPMNFMEFKRYVYDDFVNQEDFEDVRIISHLLSNNDTVADMKLMHDHFQINSEKWKFVKGMDNAIFDMELGRGNPWHKKDSIFGNDKEAYVITLLLDRNRYVRGKYVTALSPDVSRIRKEIVLLLREEYLAK